MKTLMELFVAWSVAAILVAAWLTALKRPERDFDAEDDWDFQSEVGW